MSENAYQVFDWTEFAVLHPLHILFLFLWVKGLGIWSEFTLFAKKTN